MDFGSWLEQVGQYLAPLTIGDLGVIPLTEDDWALWHRDGLAPDVAAWSARRIYDRAERMKDAIAKMTRKGAA